MSIQADENYLDMIKELSLFMTRAQIAKKLGLSLSQIVKAKKFLKKRGGPKEEMMDPQVSRCYYEGKMASIEGHPETSCPHYYSDLKSYCAWMGGYNDHKTTRKI